MEDPAVTDGGYSNDRACLKHKASSRPTQAFRAVRDVNLRFECPYCSLPIVHKGSWFKVVSNFKCAGCAENVRIGYGDKLVFFEQHQQRRNGIAKAAR